MKATLKVHNMMDRCISSNAMIDDAADDALTVKLLHVRYSSNICTFLRYDGRWTPERLERQIPGPWTLDSRAIGFSGGQAPRVGRVPESSPDAWIVGYIRTKIEK